MRVIIKQHPGTGLWVSNDGRVILPPCPKYPKFRCTYGSRRPDGYMLVQFRGKKYYVHRLVAEVHVPNPNPEDYKEIDHKDRNPQNNVSSNLRWCDRKIQMDNRQVVYNALARYGVRGCDDREAYNHAYYAQNAERIKARGRELYANPENAERKKARQREYRAQNPERNREWREKQRALGRRDRRCPDGKRRMLTDAEFNARFGSSQQIPLF